MTVLELIQDVCGEIGLPDLDAVVGSSDATVKQMFKLFHKEGKELSSKHVWPELTREAQITLVADQDAYAFPEDYDRQLFQTHWKSGRVWPLIGPLTPQDWQARKRGLASPGIDPVFRVKGFADAQFYIDPAPTSSETGTFIYYEYQSASWLRPQDWQEDQTFKAGSYCWNNGRIYKTSLGGVAGPTAPVHTTGSASDGEVNWTVFTGAYNKVLADTDVPILDSNLLQQGLHWRWLRAKRLQYDDLKREYDAAVLRDSAKTSGAQVLYMHGRTPGVNLIGRNNMPRTGYG